MRVGSAAGLVVVTERDVQVQVLAWAGDTDVEEPAFFLETLGGGECHVGGDVAVGEVEEMHDLPFEALGGVQRAQDEVVVVEVRWAGEVAARAGRVEDKVSGELLKAGSGGGTGRELFQVAQAWREVRVVLAHKRRERDPEPFCLSSRVWGARRTPRARLTSSVAPARG